MGFRYQSARLISAVSAACLKHVFRRPAANFPGKIALYADPLLIAHASSRIENSLCVVGTNGKTTVTNLLARVFEEAGYSLVCNYTGANLDSGVATALLQQKPAQWGIFECDELWLAKILPGLRSRYVLLLNLFRDQLDRVGEIEHIQESIAAALEKSPSTVLIYNADDPLCQAISDSVSNKSIAFGVQEDMGLQQNTVADARMCQNCLSLLSYELCQYGQLGKYECLSCGFRRSEPVYEARDLCLKAGGSSFRVQRCNEDTAEIISCELPGAYMVYNLLAVYALAHEAEVSTPAICQAIARFNPQNGRLQRYMIDGHPLLLNLAKNPTGFNQNLKIVMETPGPKAVAFFINDKEADGRDVSWLWDIDFQELTNEQCLLAFAGGLRKHDMQVRLKYAGLKAALVEDASDFVNKAKAALAVFDKAGEDALNTDAPNTDAPNNVGQLFVIANYTALPAVKAALDELQGRQVAGNQHGLTARGLGQEAKRAQADQVNKNLQQSQVVSCIPLSKDRRLVGRKLTIAHIYPTLLNLYGDGGNVTILAERARARGIEARVLALNPGDTLDFSQFDIVFLGGGPDREQNSASKELLKYAAEFSSYVNDEGVLLAICGGYQLLGESWLMGEESVPGLGLLKFSTKRAPGGSHNRLVGNVALESSLAKHPVVGYENHAGRTYLSPVLACFGRVKAACGYGNNDSDKADGVLYKNLFGTYLHGPLLAKNPEIADELILRALRRQVRKSLQVEIRKHQSAQSGEQACENQSAQSGEQPSEHSREQFFDLQIKQIDEAFKQANLDDSVELAANTFMCERLGL